MILDIIVDDLTGVEERFHDLYTLDGDKYKLTGVKDLKTPADIANLTNALAKERNDHKAAKAQAQTYAELGGIDDIKAKLARVAELEAAQGSHFDEAKVAEVAEARVKAIVRPLEAEKATLQQQLAEREAKIQQYEQDKKQRTIKDTVDAALKRAKVLPEFHEHAHLLAEKLFTVDEQGNVLTREGVGCTPYVDPGVWLSERQTTTSYWWGSSQGGGSQGGSGGGVIDNPWNPATFSLTKQGEIYAKNPAEAKRLAAMHGVTL